MHLLTTKLREQLEKALTSSFEPEDLRRFASERLAFDDVKFGDEVNFGQGKSNVAFDFVEVAVKYHRLEELLLALQAARPNRQTATVVAAFGLTPADLREAVLIDPLSEAQRGQLLEFLTSRYPSLTELQSALKKIDYSYEGLWVSVRSPRENLNCLIDDARNKGWDKLLAFCTLYPRSNQRETKGLLETILSPHERAGIKLLGVLDDPCLEERALVECYNNSLGTWSDPPKLPPGVNETRTYIAYAIMAVQDATASDASSDGEKPLLRFLQNVIAIETVTQELKQDIIRLWDYLAASLKLTGELKAERGGNERYSVVVELRDSVESTPQMPAWSRKAWLYRHLARRFERIDDHLPDAIENITTMPDYLNALRDRLARRVELETVVFEFFLTRKSLAHAIDQWNIMIDDAIPVEFGFENPVVVRSIDRKAPSRGKLKSRWEQLCVAPSLSNPLEVDRRSRDGDPASLYREFDLRPKLQCLLLETHFGPENNLDEFPCLRAAIAAGLPVIIWARDEAVVQCLVDQLAGWLCEPPRKLPKLVHALRRKCPPKDACHLGRHVTLFFENADYGLPENTLASGTR
jgi:vWA-MoxR associated protein C-terminal domain